MFELYVLSTRGRISVSEKRTAAKAGSPDIIEDDISDYPKDRNLSLSVIYFNCFIVLRSTSM